MVLSSILVSFVLFLGAMLPLTVRVEKVNVIAGDSVILHCLKGTDKKNPSKVIWRHNERLLIQKIKGIIYRGEKSEISTFVNEESSSLKLRNAETGKYDCEVNGKVEATYDVKAWKVNGSRNEYLLQGDTLELNLSPVSMKDTRIEWYTPHKNKVTGKELRWKLQKHNHSIQITNLTVQEDHGMWECHLFSAKIKIPYNVKVIGFSNPLDEFRFATINSSIVFSCPLNINLQEEKNTNIPIVESWKWVKNNIIVKEQNRSNMSSNFPIKQIPKVHFEDAGKYQCHIRFNHRNLSKNIHLIIMTVSADPDELRSKEDTVTLCGHISPSAPPLTELCWVNVNESTSKPKCGSPRSENKFCHIATTAGLWRCDLKVNNDVKISIDYILGNTTNGALESRFPLIEIASGAGATLLLLILIGVCVPICKSIKRKQQQAKRIAQIKQHLLAKRTCQCQRELANDYYHT